MRKESKRVNICITNSHWKRMQHFKQTILPINILKIKKKITRGDGVNTQVQNDDNKSPLVP